MIDAPRVTQEELQDYVDGRLGPEQSARIANFLASHPDIAAEVESFRAQIAGLHALYDKLLEEPIPEAMRVRLRRYQQRLWRRNLLWAAAGVVLAVLALGAGWRLNEVARPSEEPGAALVMTAQQAHWLYAEDAGLASDFHGGDNAALLAFLSWRLGEAVVLPAFDKAGLTLACVRLIPTSSGRAAMLFYRDGGGRPISLFIEPLSAGDLAPHIASGSGVATLFRIVGRVGYALTLPDTALDTRLKAMFGMSANGS